MKRPSTSLGFATTTSLAIYGVIKFLRLEGAIIMMFITGTLMAIYFSLYFLYYLQERSGKPVRLVHVIGVVLL